MPENGLLGFPGSGDQSGNVAKTQPANTLLAGPTSGTDAKPSFRSMVGADIPNALIDLTTKVTGVLPASKGGTNNQFLGVSGPSSLHVYTFPDQDTTVAALNISQTFTGQMQFNNNPPKVSAMNLTAGTMTNTNQYELRRVWHRYDWTNAMVVALGAVLSGNVSVCTLPAKTILTNAYIVITSAGGTVTTLTVSLGRTAATYVDYIVASDAKAAANTVYGDASGERGTNLTGYDLPSFTGTTVVNAQFVSTGTNLNTVTTSTGTVYLETILLP